MARFLELGQQQQPQRASEVPEAKVKDQTASDKKIEKAAGGGVGNGTGISISTVP